MSGILNLKKFSFLIYGLGSSGHSVVKYFKKNKILDYSVWDDSIKLRKKFKHKAVLNLPKSLKEVDFINNKMAAITQWNNKGTVVLNK